MLKLPTTLLIALFFWNSVPGSMGTLVLCFHNDGKTHIESAVGASHPNVKGCPGVEKLENVPDHGYCTDIVLEPVDIGPARPNDETSAHVKSPVAAEVNILCKSALFPLKPHTYYGPSTRAPPAAKSISQLICGTIVLRL